jgi:2-C-methyl-D-erythritol 4-phosphate cytidylyltransferase
VRAAAVIPAGGAGLRMGGDVRKQYLELAGQPILLRTLRTFVDHPAIEWVVVALPPGDLEAPPLRLPEGVVAVPGGAGRGDSVRAGLAAIPSAAEVVLVHDAARPLVTRAVVDRVLAAAADGVGAIAALPVADTLKRVDEAGTITATVERRHLWRAQTPQAFPRTLLVEAYRRSAEDGVAATDDAALVERYGGRVVVVEGDARNLKVTRPEDLGIAEALLGADR